MEVLSLYIVGEVSVVEVDPRLSPIYGEIVSLYIVGAEVGRPADDDAGITYLPVITFLLAPRITISYTLFIPGAHRGF